MTDGSMERVIWLRVAGLLAMGWGYLSMRGRILELGSLQLALNGTSLMLQHQGGGDRR